MRMVVIGFGLTLLASCGGGAGSANANALSGQTLDETQRRIVAMSEGERNAVMIRAIRGARQECQHVDSSKALESGAGQPMYLATCDRAKGYVVTIGPNGAGAVTATAAVEPAS